MGFESIFNILVDIFTPFLDIPVLGDILSGILGFLDDFLPEEEA